jgi:hypothetical protein
MKIALRLLLVLCLGLAASAAIAQDVSTKGAIGGQVIDSSGAAVPGATVKVSGPSVERTATTNDQGLYSFENLIPGSYKLRVEMANFKSSEVTNITVFVGKTANNVITLEAGNISETVNITAGAEIDQASTAVSSNLNDQLFSNIPVQRGVASLFYLAPGTTDSLGGGVANPSISGGSALDNLYVADGVNITDSAFGGLGTFSRSYGSLGTGILTSFVKEVQVKTAGFEPQYGQSQGGIVNIITQSGGNEFHGAVYGFARPNAFEATRKQPDDTKVNKIGKTLAVENYDFGADAGGPIIKNKLFFFGSFNPTIRREIFLGAARNANDIATGTGRDSGIFSLLGEHAGRTRTLNYAGKVDWNINSMHTLSYSIFGDPNKTNKSSWRTLNIDNATAQSVLDYGTRNQSIRYNGSLTQTWTLSLAYSHNDNHFTEGGFDNLNAITDRTGPNGRGSFIAEGLGFFEPTHGTTHRFTADTQKTFSFWGSHNVGLGYQYQRGNYGGTRDRSGPHYTVPTSNITGINAATGNPFAINAVAAGQPNLNATWDLRLANAACTLCPRMLVAGKGDVPVVLLQTRGEFGQPVFETFSNYHAVYAQDTWRINRYVTALLGLRNEQERIVGNPKNNNRVGYSFTGQWAPRLGVTVDPLGKGKTKAYYNFGRFFEYIPLDLAERSLSSELDFLNGWFIPQFTTDAGGVRHAVLNQFGTVIPVVDNAHLISRVAVASGGGACTDGSTGAATFCGGPSVSAQDPSNPILPGTKLGYAQEHVIGFEQQLPKNFTLSVRYIDRRLKRIVEDAAVVSPEGIDFFGQAYFIGNVNSKLDVAVNPISHVFTPAFNAAGDITNLPAACDPDLVNPSVTNSAGNVVGAVCWEANGKNGAPAGSFGSDGVLDGFPDPVHNYKALEIEVNKRFSNNWQLLSNWRIASLKGNFEGHFRNDNGQTDPAISSLFDFTAGDFNLLGDQFAVGPLNTDRHHIINAFGSYAFSKDSFGSSLNGLNLGLNFHLETGVPISEFLAHPAYLNAGEIPAGGRGKLGRTDVYPRLDLHADYPWALNERIKLKFIGDFFNVFNSTKVRLPDQRRQLTVGVNNVDFLKPNSFYLPFNMRLGMRLEF